MTVTFKRIWMLVIVSFGGRRMTPFIIKKIIIELRDDDDDDDNETISQTPLYSLYQGMGCIKRETSAALGVYQLPNHPCHACSLFYIPTQDYNIPYCYIAFCAVNNSFLSYLVGLNGFPGG